jgi:phosphatidate cytidylyltransferase
MVIVGTACVVAGGVWFQMVTVFVTAVMIWELWTMIEPQGPRGGCSSPRWWPACCPANSQFRSLGASPCFSPRQSWRAGPRPREGTFFAFALAVQAAGWGLVTFRIDFGFFWLCG